MSNRTVLHLVYLGRHFEKDPGYHFLVIDPKDNNGQSYQTWDSPRVSIYKKPFCKGTLVGCILSIEEADNKVYLATAKHAGYWKNEDDRDALQAAEMARSIAHEQERGALARVKNSSLEAKLKSVHSAYHSLPTRKSRAAFLAWVIQQVTA